MRLALIICYPLLLHIAIWRELPGLQLVALIFLALGLLYENLKQKNAASWGLLIFLVSLITASHQYGGSIYFAYFPPVVIFMLLLFVFANSLRKNQIPIVTDIGEKTRGPLSPEMRKYTRSVTLVWSLFFLVMTLWSIVLPWFVSPVTWSWLTNFAHYIIVAALFSAEYIYRKWRFQDHDHPNFMNYIKIVVKADVVKRAPNRNG